MVERERGEGEAIALTGGGQLQQDGEVPGAAEGERDGEEGDAEDEREEEKGRDDVEGWSEIRLAIEELSPARLIKLRGGGDDDKPAAPSPPTLPFLALSHLLLRVLDKIGPTMAVLRLDVQRNIEVGTESRSDAYLQKALLALPERESEETPKRLQVESNRDMNSHLETYSLVWACCVRLQELYLLDPAKYSTLTEIVEKEVKEGTARKVDSCARAVLWLARSMDFTIALLQRFEEDPDQQSLAQLVEAAYEVSLKPWHGWISSAACKIALKLIPERKIFTSLLVGMGQDCSTLKDEIEKLALLLRPLLDDIHSMMVGAASDSISRLQKFYLASAEHDSCQYMVLTTGLGRISQAKFRLDRLKST
ncbi:glycolipid transfer protein 3 isoform X1 [Panicum miliaceum]|uniref:Glycolipid transfer protein 3 isoform X1 n=1 Tax=Panicum miliaceum TaxID=4540 RepID=A0A3L6Q5F0_PANMI|nr:glycolipid transfer protein 3 isoform X1 [Panicum miliaceum]